MANPPLLRGLPMICSQLLRDCLGEVGEGFVDDDGAAVHSFGVSDGFKIKDTRLNPRIYSMSEINHAPFPCVLCFSGFKILTFIESKQLPRVHLPPIQSRFPARLSACNGLGN